MLLMVIFCDYYKRQSYVCLQIINIFFKILLDRLCAEFEANAEKILSVPPDTASLMSLITFVEKFEEVTMHVLDKKLLDSLTRLSFLVDYATITPADMRLNITTFSWNSRMSGIIQEHRKIVADKTLEYQEALKVSSIFQSFDFFH